jgi:hypothetical protein
MGKNYIQIIIDDFSFEKYGFCQFSHKCIHRIIEFCKQMHQNCVNTDFFSFEKINFCNGG